VIHAHVKVLKTLKTLHSVVSFAAFEDYVQFSENTAHNSFHAFCNAVLHDTEMVSTFLPTMMTRQDADQARKLHTENIELMVQLFRLIIVTFIGTIVPRHGKVNLRMERMTSLPLFWKPVPFMIFSSGM
jgi:hypothetical protein